MTRALRIWFPALVACGMLTLSQGRADTTRIDEAIAQTRLDLADAVAELNRVRDEEGQERSALAGEVRTLQEEVRRLRERRQAAQRADTAHAAERSRMRERAEATDREFRAMSEMMIEFRRGMETRLHPAVWQRHTAQADAIDAALVEDEAQGHTLSALDSLLRLALEQAEQAIGIRPFPGEAADPNGVVRSGTFLVVGPLALFAAEDPLAAGYVAMDAGGKDLLLVPHLRVADQQAIAEAAGGRPSLIPIDASGGAAIKMARARESWLERVRSGGIIMIPLLLLALVCVALTAYKLWALRRMDIDAEPSVSRILEALDRDDVETARAETAALPAPWGEVLDDAIEHRHAEQAVLEEILQDQILFQAPRVEQYLGALAVSAAAAPLLGLLGTVTGMIHTFRLITLFGTGDARTLSGGISEALITTQFGLLLAIPALLVHAWLSRRAKRIIADLEQAALRFVREVAAHRRAPEAS